jgi:aspartyl-tRNA(Asn)/glutamyl-tRNA(Gln) amidotransferase subunit A
VVSEPLWRMDAGALVAAYRSGETTPTQVLDSIVGRIEDVNGRINAIVTLDIPGARAAAAASGERYRRGASSGRLDGVPATVKDNLFVRGFKTSWGSRLFTDFVAPQDDLAVAALRAQGVVILGKTNTPELALSGHTDNFVFGSTGNPWAPDLSPGGSSGGAVAAVAAGFGPLALATDAGGSIRRPCAQTGVMGLKPGLGRVPRRYGFPPLAHDLQVIGPIARSVADLRAMFQIIATPGAPATPPEEALRIAAIERVHMMPVDPAISKAFQETCESLRNLGHQVVPSPSLWDADEAGTLFRSLSAVGVARVTTRIRGWEDQVTPSIRELSAIGVGRQAIDYVSDLDRLTAFRLALRDAVEAFDVIATPASPTLSWPRIEAGPQRIGGCETGPYDAAAFSTAINLAGLPAIVVPMQMQGLPAGIQLIGPMMSEELLLAVAAQIERVRPWRRLAPLPASGLPERRPAWPSESRVFEKE